MERATGITLSAVIATIVISLFCAGTASAIPAFGRQNKAECSSCHTIYPQLNEFGEAFRKNGYVWPGKSPATKEKEELDARQPALHEAARKNESLWLAGIPEMVPISFTGTLTAAYNENAPDSDTLDFSTRALLLHAGGNFREKAAFFLTYTLYSEGIYDPRSFNGNTPHNNDPDVRELFIAWRHAMDTPVNLKAGRFRPQLSLWKSTNKITLTTPATQVYRVGDSPFTVDSPEDALEINALATNSLFLAAGVVDRKGQKTKEGYGHVSYKWGGTDMSGHEPMIDLDNDSIWDFLSFTVGGYAYFGNNATIKNSKADIKNNYYRAGVDLDVLYKRLQLRFSGISGRDSDPNFDHGKRQTSLVFTSEADYSFLANVIGAFRYENENAGNVTTRRYISALSYAPLPNTKLVLEYNLEDKQQETSNIGLLGVMFSF